MYIQVKTAKEVCRTLYEAPRIDRGFERKFSYIMDENTLAGSPRAKSLAIARLFYYLVGT